MSESGPPICPVCGDKFPNAKSPLGCKKCGLPVEIVAMGPQEVARWQRKKFGKRVEPREAHTVEQKRPNKVITFPSPRKRRNKPGRRGVKA